MSRHEDGVRLLHMLDHAVEAVAMAVPEPTWKAIGSSTSPSCAFLKSWEKQPLA